MKDKKNGIGTTSPVVETKDYWTGKEYLVNNILFTVTSGDDLFLNPMPGKHNLLTSSFDLLINVELYPACYVLDQTGKFNKAVVIPNEMLPQIKKIAKRIYKYKTIKEKSSDKTRAVGKRKE